MAANAQLAQEISVTGRVQGVGFRMFTVRTAQACGVRGWVRNEPDGSVLIHAVGSADAMDQFRTAVRRGPTFGRVDDMTLEPLPSQTQYTQFDVKYT